MKRINALSGMKWRVLLLVLQAGYTADVAIADHEIDESDFLCAASDGPESVRVERVLTAGQINSSTVDVGALAVAVYEQAARHPISETWTQLDTVRGSIKAVDSRRLIVGLEPDEWSEWIALERIQTRSLIGVPFSGSADRDHTRTKTTKRVQLAQAEPEDSRSDSLSEKTKTEDVKKHYMRPGGPPTFEEEKEKFFRQLREKGKSPLETQTAPEDSLKVKESPPLFDIADKDLRIFAKAGAGIITSAATTAPLIGVISWASSLYSESRRSDENGGEFDGVGIFIFSLFSHVFGSPIGVTLVDPHDSPNETLKWAQIGGLGGLGVGVVFAGIPEPLGTMGFFAAIYLGPVIGSIYGSEKSRKPPEFRRVSFSLAPTFNGGLSTFATLHF